MRSPVDLAIQRIPLVPGRLRVLVLGHGREAVVAGQVRGQRVVQGRGVALLLLLALPLPLPRRGPGHLGVLQLQPGLLAVGVLYSTVHYSFCWL